MKTLFKCVLLAVCLAPFYNCASDSDTDDCTKLTLIPQIYMVNNQTYSYDIEQEVPCDFPDPKEISQIQPPVLENFTYEVISFNFTPDTGNNTNRWQFEIKLNNPNNYAVVGFPLVSIEVDGTAYAGSYTANCKSIAANSSCILSYDEESSLDLGIINTIELVNVAYYLTN
tara:strand:- start:40555 stop:41067 length:513 start_codon:yes stop_codon:yes gene_type:complete